MNRRTTLCLLAVAGVLATFGISAACRSGTTPHNAIASAYARERPFEPWLSEVPFGPLSDKKASRSAHPSDPDIALAVARLEATLGSGGATTSLSWAAAGRLLSGDIDKAVKWYERARAASPQNAVAACDVAAAYLIRFDASGDSTDVPRAIDSARRGTRIDERQAGCWFNLALAFERAGLRTSARTAFAHAASLASPPWREEALARAARVEASRRREDLVQALGRAVTNGDESGWKHDLADDADLIEEVLERQVLVRWAEAIRDGDREMSRRWQALGHGLAEAVHAAISDEHAVRLVSAFDACTSRCAVGWIAHVTAMVAWDRERYVEARGASAAANAAFGSSVSPINASRVLLRVTLARIEGRNDVARALVMAYRTHAVESRYLMIAGRLTWQAALLESERGNFGRAVNLYQQAAELLVKAHDREGAAMVDSLLSSKYQQLADLPHAWKYAVDALDGLDACRELRQRAILAATAVLATASGFHESAIAFREPLLDAARRGGAAIYLARLLSEDATTLLAIGRTEEARERLEEAAANVERIDDAGAADMSRALVAAAQGRWWTAHSPLRATALFSQALDIYRARGNFFAMPVLELERGRALLAAGLPADAERAFEAGVDAAERERRTSSVDAERVALLSERWGLYAALIDLKLAQHDEPGAAELLAQARASNLLEAAGVTASSDAAPLADDVVALEYVVLPSGVYGWLRAASERTHFRVDLSADDLRQRVDAFLNAIARRDAVEVRRGGRALFDALLGPVRDRIDSAARLVVVADGPLHAVPFAALEDPATGRTLLDDVSVTVTPSLRFYATSAREPRFGARFDIVAVGNPKAARAGELAFPLLPGADIEATSTAALYAHAYVLQGESATRGRFLEVAPLGRVPAFRRPRCGGRTRSERLTPRHVAVTR